MADVFFQTYQAIGNREDLTDIISTISPVDTPMLSRFGRTQAFATTHEWQTDALASASSSGVIEGADVTTTALTPTTRVSNYTQISQRKWRVSNTQQAVRAAGRGNEKEYQAMKAMKELARDMEKTIHDGTGASGASATARELVGVRSAISTNTETGTGTGSEALTSEMTNDLLQTIYEAGGNPNAIYAHPTQKRKISAFTTPITRYQDAQDRRYTAVIAKYDSDFGSLDVLNDRYATNTELLALQEDQFAVAYLRPVEITELPDDGGGPKGKVEAEYTLQYGNEAASGKITGLST